MSRVVAKLPECLAEYRREFFPGDTWAFSPCKARIARYTSQLDRELVSYNVMVEDLEKRMGRVFQKGHELLEVIVHVDYIFSVICVTF